MLIEAGYSIAYHCPAPTSLVLLLSVHPERFADLRSPDYIACEPFVRQAAYYDTFGNRVTRIDVAPGLSTFRSRFTIADSGLPDAIPADRPLTPVSQLPNETLLYLMPSRYCDSDNLANFAWSHFAGRGGGRATIQAICDFAHASVRFDYMRASATRTASDALREGVGVCRDFAHLAIALGRAMNIPARYCTGYLGDIGVPADPAPMDFSAWFECWLDGTWRTFDARHNIPRIGRILIARGRDAADVAISTAFGVAELRRFEVTTREIAA